MKKCRTLLSVCTAFAFVVLMLSACTSSEDENKIEPASGGTKSVSIKITQDAVTRVVGESPVIDENADVIVGSGGHLLFVDNENTVTHYVEITFGSTNSGGSDPRAAFEDLTDAGVEIENVPKESNNVYIVLNLPTSGIATAPAGGWVGATLSAVNDVLITAEHLYDTAGGVANVPLSGSGMLEAVQGQDDEFTASVDLEPIASRFEISKISLDVDGLASATPALKVDGDFTVAGIYINKYYPRVSVTGNYPFVTLNAGNVAQRYDQANDEFLWTAANFGRYLYTINAGTTAASVTATNDKAWAYNLFPNIGKNTLPHIILKITGLKVVVDDALGTTIAADADGRPYDGDNDWYITVEGYKLENEEIANLEKGYVYAIDEIKFPLSALTDVPEKNVITVGVTATLIRWTRKVLNPIL